MEHPPAVLFDLDGTLVDSLRDIAESMNEVLTEYGHPVHPVEDYRFMVGDGLEKLIDRSLPAPPDPKQLQQLSNAFKISYAQRWTNHCRPYDGIRALLERLSAAEVHMGVLSNKPEAFTRDMVHHCFPEVTFKPIQGANDRFPLKPSPEAGQAIALLWQQPPRSIWYVGDTRTDMLFANATGMRALGVTWGFRDREELEAYDPEAVVDQPSEVADLILGRI